MSKMNYALSDGLAALRGALSACAETGLTMTPEAVAQMTLTMAVLERREKVLENEVSRHRWNDLARDERAAS